MFLLMFSYLFVFHVELPTVTLPSYPVPVQEGKNVTLICNTTGTSPLSIKWTKVNDSTVLSNTSALTLFNVKRPGTPSETVQYGCTAKNGYGDPAYAVVTVHVQCEKYSVFVLLMERMHYMHVYVTSRNIYHLNNI